MHCNHWPNWDHNQPERNGFRAPQWSTFTAFWEEGAWLRSQRRPRAWYRAEEPAGSSLTLSFLSYPEWSAQLVICDYRREGKCRGTTDTLSTVLLSQAGCGGSLGGRPRWARRSWWGPGRVERRGFLPTPMSAAWLWSRAAFLMSASLAGRREAPFTCFLVPAVEYRCQNWKGC